MGSTVWAREAWERAGHQHGEVGGRLVVQVQVGGGEGAEPAHIIGQEHPLGARPTVAQDLPIALVGILVLPFPEPVDGLGQGEHPPDPQGHPIHGQGHPLFRAREHGGIDQRIEQEREPGVAAGFDERGDRHFSALPVRPALPVLLAAKLGDGAEGEVRLRRARRQRCRLPEALLRLIVAARIDEGSTQRQVGRRLVGVGLQLQLEGRQRPRLAARLRM